MPELPEVETIRTQLSELLPFLIEKAHYSPVADSILAPKNIHFDPVGQIIYKIRRHGKMLDFKLTEGGHIVSHLGMSGGWRKGLEKVGEKHTHVQFTGQDGEGREAYLAYVDPRRFGSMLYLDEDNFKKYTKRLGPDISGPKFDGDYVYGVLKKYPKQHLKAFLLEQKYFAGIGNYIASEVCARAGIRPTRRTGRVSKPECRRIVTATKDVIAGQLQGGGLTFQGGYTVARGEKGEGLSHLVVFHQETCGLCKAKGKSTAVKKITLAGRGTYYCPRCQK